jgi:hypothetical protein
MSAEKGTPANRAGEISSKMDQIESIIAVLSAQQRALDGLGFSLACIHLNEAIEALRLDMSQVQSQL